MKTTLTIIAATCAAAFLSGCMSKPREFWTEKAVNGYHLALGADGMPMQDQHGDYLFFQVREMGVVYDNGHKWDRHQIVGADDDHEFFLTRQ